MIVNLQHPVGIVVEQLSSAVMIMDQDTRHPVHGARSAAAEGDAPGISIQGQVKWQRKKDPDIKAGGVRFESTGYVLCLRRDLDKKLGAGNRFAYGDRIVAIGTDTGLALYITFVEPCIHDPAVNGAQGYKFHFSDRSPNN